MQSSRRSHILQTFVRDCTYSLAVSLKPYSTNNYCLGPEVRQKQPLLAILLTTSRRFLFGWATTQWVLGPSGQGS